jgi:prepilin-type N-terminal cleavage/methylation domain-containing protein
MARRERAFTLIELLVVIAIVALLLSILTPVLQRTRRQARVLACQSNLRQWGIVLQAYTNDNNNRFFRGMVDSWWNDWIEILEPFYHGEEKLTCCPLATKTRDAGGEGVFAAWNDAEGDYGSYGLSAWVCDADQGAVYGDGNYWRTPGVTGAQNVPVFLDCRGIAGWPDYSSMPPEYDGEPPMTVALAEQMKNFCINRHRRGTINCLFTDWSVREVGLKELWTLKWHRNFDTRGPWTQAGGMKPNDWPRWMRNFKD